MCTTATAQQSGDSATIKHGFMARLGQLLENFSAVDTTFVEPQRYNFAAMLQNTNTYERYTVTQAEDGVELQLSPAPSYRVGPYFGWRWLFLGYTIDLTHLKGSNRKTEFTLSLYSSRVGIDLFYRKTGNDFKIKYMQAAGRDLTSLLQNAPYGGLTASIKGFNVYYILNHKKFSYPAAFSQSTVQRKSAGSALVGMGYTRHGLHIDWKALKQITAERMGVDTAEQLWKDDAGNSQVAYTDYSLWGGYAYNWVPARYWLLAASLSVGISYKHTAGSYRDMEGTRSGFNIGNMNFDGVGRFGVVYNNMRWFAGMSTVVHTYNYKKKEFSTNSTFGYLNFYIGFNFGKR